MDVGRQCRLLNELLRFRGELAQIPSFAALTAEGYGPGYGEIEAQLLHCMVRHLKPARVIEVGSGDRQILLPEMNLPVQTER